MRQDETDVWVLPFAARDHEGCSSFEGFVRDFHDWYAEEIVWVWSFWTGLGAVEENRCSASAQFFPDWVEPAVP